MTDVRIKEAPRNLEAVWMDFLLLPTGALDEREELATAIRVALGTDRLSAVDEVLPDLDSTDRRGWWGDLEAEEIWGGWPIGCKNWLLTRAKITDVPSKEGSTLQRANQYTKDALQPFLDKRVATKITTSAIRTELNRIEVTATIYRGPLSEIELRYQLLWQENIAVNDDLAPIIDVSSPHNIRIPYRNLTMSINQHSVTSGKLPFRRNDWPNPRGRRIRNSFFVASDNLTPGDSLF